MGQELSETFYSLLLTSGIGLILAICRIFYKSKCKQVDICCLKIVRNVEEETEIDIQMPQNNPDGGGSPRGI